MNVLIYGAGAIGCFQGAFLARAGHTVTLYGREAPMRKIAAEGLHIDGIFGEFHTTSLDTAWRLEQVDTSQLEIVLLCVQAYDTAAAMEEIELLAQGGALVVSLQNGLGNVEQIAQHIGPEQTIAGRIITGVTMTEANWATVTVTADATRIGPVAGGLPMGQVENIAATLNEAGLPTCAAHDVMKYIWAKVFYNSALNPLSALLNQTYGQLGQNAYTRKVMDEVIDEGFAVARAAGVDLFWDEPEEYRRVFYGQEVPITSAHRSSMLQAIEKGKRTEIDALNGALARLGGQHGISVPVNRTLTELIKAKEAQLLSLNEPSGPVPDLLNQ
jgi:2-dehydropantoate 2-reductase